MMWQLRLPLPIFQEHWILHNYFSLSLQNPYLFSEVPPYFWHRGCRLSLLSSVFHGLNLLSYLFEICVANNFLASHLTTFRSCWVSAQSGDLTSTISFFSDSIAHVDPFYRMASSIGVVWGAVPKGCICILFLPTLAKHLHCLDLLFIYTYAFERSRLIAFCGYDQLGGNFIPIDIFMFCNEYNQLHFAWNRLVRDVTKYYFASQKYFSGKEELYCYQCCRQTPTWMVSYLEPT